MASRANRAARRCFPRTSAGPPRPRPRKQLAENVDFPAQLRVRNRLDEMLRGDGRSRSNFASCAAVARATRRASPSAATWLTRPTDCAFVALMLRPVSSRSRTTALPRSRFRRGMPPKPGISPRRNSGKQKRAILSAMIRSQVRASSNPPPKSDAVNRGDGGQRGGVDSIHHAMDALEKIADARRARWPRSNACQRCDKARADRRRRKSPPCARWK